MARWIVWGREVKTSADRHFSNEQELGSIDAQDYRGRTAPKAAKADFDRARLLLRLAPNVEITRLVWVKN